MEWINIKDQLPIQREYCWIYGYIDDPNDKFVFEGYFDKRSCDLRPYPCIEGPGWEYDTDMSNYVMLDQISHWMTYFTPSAPKD